MADYLTYAKETMNFINSRKKQGPEVYSTGLCRMRQKEDPSIMMRSVCMPGRPESSYFFWVYIRQRMM